MIPFSHIFGFERKKFTSTKVSIYFERVINEKPIFKSGSLSTLNVDDVADGIIIFSSLKWRIPYIQ